MEQTKIFAIFVCRSNFNGKMGSRLACWDSGRPTKQAQFQMPFSFSLHDFTWVGDFRRGGMVIDKNLFWQNQVFWLLQLAAASATRAKKENFLSIR